jgi:hypothetical protein
VQLTVPLGFLLVLSCSLREFIEDRELWKDEQTLISILLHNKAFFPVLREYIRVHAVSLFLLAAFSD